ncbi:PAS domain-containing protein, partial [Halopenitus sp. H-Gu1]|uniref:PAS domain-containing sensor histidine kinase n=1 Tax=Halopenitus sp. H-Gu1 TaxID=3242697 RepID=UPI00359E1E9B
DGEIWSSEVLNENRSGELYYAEQTVAPIKTDSGDIEGFVAIQRDVTERKEREREQQEAQRRLSLAIDTADAGVWEWDIQAENMIWEESMETLVGLDPGTFGGSHEDFIERVHPEDRETVEQANTRAREQEGDFEQEFRIRHESGNYIWLLCRARLFTKSEDSSKRMIGVAIDISDRVDRARQLRVLDRVLRHNLRNDMTAIKGYAETIRTEVEGVDEEIETILEKSGELLQTADKEREIVETITDPPDQKGTDVVSVCQRVVAAMRKRYSESNIELNHPEEASALATGKLGRGIEELIENAIIHNDRETPDVSLTVETSEETVQVEIADNGPGIPEEEVNVLTREYDVEPLYHGSGLGLWLVNWIVRQADGTLTFKENDPRGSIVMIELQRSI